MCIMAQFKVQIVLKTYICTELRQGRSLGAMAKYFSFDDCAVTDISHFIINKFWIKILTKCATKFAEINHQFA